MFNRQSPTTVVVCEKCKHLIKKADAQVIERKILGGHYPYTAHQALYYCPEHIRPYDREETFHGSRSYYKEFEVDENGKVLRSK